MRIIVPYLSVVIASIFLCSCQNEPDGDTQNKTMKEHKKFVLKKVDTSDATEDNTGKNRDTIFIKGKSMIFFTKSRKEFQRMLNAGGEESKWEFDMIYNNFKKTADNSQIPLKELNIYSTYTDKPVIQFLSEKKDTFIFNRTANDYFIGQLFFNGIDSFRLEEGLIKTEDLEMMISDFFKLKTRIEIANVQELSDSFRYYQVDTTIVTVSDTIDN